MARRFLQFSAFKFQSFSIKIKSYADVFLLMKYTSAPQKITNATICNICKLFLVDSRKSAKIYPAPATTTDQIMAAGTFNEENLNGVISAIPIIIGLIFLIP